MGLRTDDTMVKEVLAAGGDYDLRLLPSLTRYIKAASLIVDRVVACAAAKGEALTTEEALEIETWLAAHNYCRSDKAESSRSTNGASATFQGQTGKGIEGTFYGQTALTLDPSGCLRQVTSGQRASVGWAGRAPSEQTDYVDRS